jgi:hypothetical protein
MIAEKITVKIFIEVLSIDVVPGLLQELAQQYLNGNTSGHLNKDDGDSIDWGLMKEQVTI